MGCQLCHIVLTCYRGGYRRRVEAGLCAPHTRTPASHVCAGSGVLQRWCAWRSFGICQEITYNRIQQHRRARGVCVAGVRHVRVLFCRVLTTAGVCNTTERSSSPLALFIPFCCFSAENRFDMASLSPSHEHKDTYRVRTPTHKHLYAFEADYIRLLISISKRI